MSRQDQDNQVLKQAKEQIEYCEKLYSNLTNQQINELHRQAYERDKLAVGDNIMARGRPAKPTQALKLMEALTFVEVATEDHGQSMFEFVNLTNKRAVCFDGVMAAGMEIEEELNLCPQVSTLKKALAKSGKSLALTELPSGRLSVKGEKITVQVPCVKADELPPVAPDMPVAPINDELKAAFKALEGIITDTGDRVFETAVLLEANFATATNGKVLMQYWHGIDLPPGLVIPRSFVQAISKQTKELKGFGYNPGYSVTFWFEDNSWYKTQIYQDPYPDCNTLLNQTNMPTDCPAGLWEACKEVAEFHDNEWVSFKENAIIAGVAKYPVEGLQDGKQFDYKQIKRVIPYIKTLDYTTYADRAFFFGDKVRGIAMCIAGDSE